MLLSNFVRCSIKYIDFEGRSGGESVKRILSVVKPRQLVSKFSDDRNRVSQMGSTGGEQFGQNSQKLHESYQIDIFGSKECGGHGGQANFPVEGGSLVSSHPLWEPLLNDLILKEEADFNPFISSTCSYSLSFQERSPVTILVSG